MERPPSPYNPEEGKRGEVGININNFNNRSVEVGVSGEGPKQIPFEFVFEYLNIENENDEYKKLVDIILRWLDWDKKLNDVIDKKLIDDLKNINAEKDLDKISSLLQKLEEGIRNKYPEYKEGLKNYIKNYYSKETK